MRSGAYALCFAASLPQLQAEARKCGYALAVHGSMATDLDLIACPWTEEAWEPQKLVDLLTEIVDGRCYSDIDPNPTSRPHGRLAWSIYFNRNLRSGPYIDISVMPRRPAAPTLKHRLHDMDVAMLELRQAVEAVQRDNASLEASNNVLQKSTT
jgi:hypothetical protein